VLFGLAILIESCLELTFFWRNNENSDISLASTHDHVRDVVFVPRGVKNCESSVFKRKVKFSILNSLSSFSFIRINISNTSQLPCLHMIFLGFLLVSCQLLFINFTELFHNVSGKSWFTSVDMTNENDVDIFLFELINVNIFILSPLSIHESLNVDFRISFSNNYLLFFFNWSSFNLSNWLILLRFISFFFFLIKLKIIAGLFFLKIIHLSIVKLLSNTICILSISVHGFIENVHIHDLSSENVRCDIIFEIIEVSLISRYLLLFPFFINCFFKSCYEI